MSLELKASVKNYLLCISYEDKDGKKHTMELDTEGNFEFSPEPDLSRLAKIFIDQVQMHIAQNTTCCLMCGRGKNV